MSTATIYSWRAKFGGMDVSDARRLKTLEGENARLKKLLADTLLDNSIQEMNATRDVVIHAVSVGLDLEILRWLAEDTGGTYVGIP